MRALFIDSNEKAKIVGIVESYYYTGELMLYTHNGELIKVDVDEDGGKRLMLKLLSQGFIDLRLFCVDYIE